MKTSIIMNYMYVYVCVRRVFFDDLLAKTFESVPTVQHHLFICLLLSSGVPLIYS